MSVVALKLEAREVAARIVISGLLTQLIWQPLAPGVPELEIDADRLIDSTLELLLHGFWSADGLPNCS
jgi:hypothetical protein